jgi:multiple sugar transport system substrate-binding protein/putative aldouronate transport system substrate-binding protein
MKKFLSLLLTVAMLLGMCSFTVAAAEEEPMEIVFFDDAANYNGEQTGWFAKVVLDRFNIKLNIIATQVIGDEVFATRSADGDLGDIIIMDKSKFADVVKAGLVKDIGDRIGEIKSLAPFISQIDTFNQDFLGADAGVYYGIPDQMTDTSPTTLTSEMVYSSPQLRWDLYKAIGMPEIKDENDLLDALAKIHEIHPTNEAGDPAYPISLWPDWDNGDNMSGPANVVQLTTWWGDKLKGSAMLKPDFSFVKLYDKDSGYYKATKFINKAYQMGLVDPESFEQDWNSIHPKISSGRIDLIWYDWQPGFWNSQERLDNGTAFQMIPVTNFFYYADADTYYGGDRAWGIGSKVEGAKYDKIIEFLDWYASPEGLTFEHCGIEGLNYTVGEDGKFIPYKDNALMDNLPVPEEYGGGGFNDGNNAINQWLLSAKCTNPNTGETYTSTFWASYIAKNMTQMKKEWQERFGAENPVDWLKKNNRVYISPNCAARIETDTDDIALLRNTIDPRLAQLTWQLFAAPSDEEFEAKWDAMVEEIEGLGYDELYKFDVAKWQVQVDAKIAAGAVE